MKYLKQYEKNTIKKVYTSKLEDKDIYIFNYNSDLINGITCEQCFIKWSSDIIENDEGIEKINVKIENVELKLDVDKFTHLDVENFETKNEIENHIITKKKEIKFEFEYENMISFPLKPKGLEIDYRNMTVLVEFD